MRGESRHSEGRGVLAAISVLLIVIVVVAALFDL